MSEEISPEIFAHLVELAALELSPQESETLRRELNNQLKAIHEMQAIPLDADTPIASRGVTYTAASAPALRRDLAQPQPAPQNLLKNAPETAEGYLVVPETPHQDLK
ncbi:MAG: hypothetical protein Fur0035_24450 [Anaerolineales bacterium]